MCSPLFASTVKNQVSCQNSRVPEPGKPLPVRYRVQFAIFRLSKSADIYGQTTLSLNIPGTAIGCITQPYLSKNQQQTYHPVRWVGDTSIHHSAFRCASVRCDHSQKQADIIRSQATAVIKTRDPSKQRLHSLYRRLYPLRGN